MEILIADDHAIFRKGLRHLIEGSTDYKISVEASNAVELLSMLRKKTPDMIILDINMPGISGLEVLKDIHNLYPKLPVLVLSMYPENQYAIRAFKAGCSGYVSKGGREEDLLDAISKVSCGKKYISPDTAESMLNEMIDIDPLKKRRLSDRELTVFNLIASGNTITEIAGQLNLSIKTVSTYRSRILNKLNLKSTNELILFAARNERID